MHHIFKGKELTTHIKEFECFIDVELLSFQKELAINNVFVALRNLEIIV